MRFKHTSILALTATFLLAGCGSTPVSDKANLDLGVYTKSTLVDTPSQDITSELNRKNDFMIILYEPSCACWTEFRDSVVKTLLKEVSFPIYFIKTKDTTSTFGGLFEGIATTLADTPIVGIYEKGELKTSLRYKYNDTRFSDYTTFKSWLDEKVNYPKSIFRVNESGLNSLLASNNKFYVYYTLNACPDCSYFLNAFLFDYVRSHNLKHPIYYIDTGEAFGWRSDRWNEVMGIYGVSNAVNRTFGYDKGFVPTLQYIEGDGTDYVSLGDISPILKDMLVTSNDAVELVNGEYRFAQTFFDGTRPLAYTSKNLSNEVIASSLVDVTDTSIKLNRAQGFSKYYEPIAKEFFAYYG